MQYKRMFARFLIFAMMGLLLEVFGGAFGSLLRYDWNLRGSTSPWMMFDYGLFGIILMSVATRLKQWRIPLVGRAAVYMLVIFLVEYVSGVIFHFGMGIQVWDYSSMRYNLHGQIALNFVPIWYFLGLVAEYLYVRVDACAVVLTKGLRAEELQDIPTPTKG
jgi:uncharacterized membrane protein